MYKVINFFTDLQDFGHPYKVGDVYPRQRRIVDEARVQELLGSKNRQGRPLIELVEETETTEKEIATVEVETVAENTEAEQVYSKTDIMRMNKADLVATAQKYGIADAETLSGKDLKEKLIAQLQL